MSLVIFSWVDPTKDPVLTSDVAPTDTGFAFIIKQQPTKTYALDASPSRQTSISAQVTEHPVESGGPVTDYIRPLPMRLSVECFISNTPIGNPPTGGNDGAVASTETQRSIMTANYGRGPRYVEWQGLEFTRDFNRVKSAFDDLVTAILNGSLFTITTSLNTYSKMAATQMTVSETPEKAGALQFTMEFQQIRIVSTQTVDVPPRKALAHQGPKTPSAADAAQENKVQESMLHAGVRTGLNP